MTEVNKSGFDQAFWKNSGMQILFLNFPDGSLTRSNSKQCPNLSLFIKYTKFIRYVYEGRREGVIHKSNNINAYRTCDFQRALRICAYKYDW